MCQEQNIGLLAGAGNVSPRCGPQRGEVLLEFQARRAGLCSVTSGKRIEIVGDLALSEIQDSEGRCARLRWVHRTRRTSPDRWHRAYSRMASRFYSYRSKRRAFGLVDGAQVFVVVHLIGSGKQPPFHSKGVSRCDRVQSRPSIPSPSVWIFTDGINNAGCTILANLFN
jgi:hypothetical protein